MAKTKIKNVAENLTVEEREEILSLALEGISKHEQMKGHIFIHHPKVLL